MRSSIARKFILTAIALVTAFTLLLAGCGSTQSNVSADVDDGVRPAASSEGTVAEVSTVTINGLDDILEQNDFTEIIDDIESGYERRVNKQEDVEKICELMTELDLKEVTKKKVQDAGYCGGTSLILVAESVTAEVDLFGPFVTAHLGDDKHFYYKTRNLDARDAIFDIVDQYPAVLKEGN